MHSIPANRGSEKDVNGTLNTFCRVNSSTSQKGYLGIKRKVIYVTWECLAHSKHPPVIYEGRHSAEPKLTLAALFNIHASGVRLVQDVDIHGLLSVILVGVQSRDKDIIFRKQVIC